MVLAYDLGPLGWSILEMHHRKILLISNIKALIHLVSENPNFYKSVVEVSWVIFRITKYHSKLYLQGKQSKVKKKKYHFKKFILVDISYILLWKSFTYIKENIKIDLLEDSTGQGQNQLLFSVLSPALNTIVFDTQY